MTAPQSKKITEDANEKLLAAMAERFRSMREVEGTVDSFRGEMKGDVENLEDTMTDGFKTQGIQRKKDNDDLVAKMRKGFERESAKTEADFKNEENERKKVQEELAFYER